MSASTDGAPPPLVRTVALGIETAEQAERLRALGWVHGQGWLFGRPAAAPGRPSLPVVGAAP